LFIKTSCSEADEIPPQLDWEFNETVGGVPSDNSSLQGARLWMKAPYSRGGSLLHPSAHQMRHVNPNRWWEQ